MALETELKLAISAHDIPALLAHSLLAAAPKERTLLNTYFDTPELLLQSRRMAVRERSVGAQTLLTVKTAGVVQGGLSRRSEWEAPTTPGQFDFAALVDEPQLAADLVALAPRLVPIFTTNFVRRTWVLMHQGARIEVALDQGEVSSATPSGPRQQPLLELELELEDGPEAALHDLAQVLGQAAQLEPVTISKAERGYALFLSREGGVESVNAL